MDIDPTHRRVFGRTKQGAEVGRFKGVRTLHPVPATLSTPTARPVIAAVRLRRGKAADAPAARSPRSTTVVLLTKVWRCHLAGLLPPLSTGVKSSSSPPVKDAQGLCRRASCPVVGLRCFRGGGRGRRSVRRYGG